MKISRSVVSLVGFLVLGCGAAPGDELSEAELDSVEAGSEALVGTAIAGELDGFLFKVPCVETNPGDDCMTSTWQPKHYRKNFTMAGTPGVRYNVRIRVRGITEGKNYIGGTRRAGPQPVGSEETSSDYLYTGGTIPPSLYNSYSLLVSPAVPGAATAYRLNSASEEHTTFALSYEVIVPVFGDGVISFQFFDRNSRQMKNCGMGPRGPGGPCEPRSISLSTASPAAPSSFVQPYEGQWVHFDVLSVSPAR